MDHNKYDIENIAKGIIIAPSEISEILGKPPRRIYFYANLVVFFVLFSLIISALFIPLQTTLPITVIITPMNNAAKYFDNINHKIDSFNIVATASVSNAGSIKVDQIVNISLDAYPAKEYGLIIGYIEKIKPFSLLNKIDLAITLKHGMITTKHKKIPIQPILTGSGTILINETNYFSKLFLN